MWVYSGKASWPRFLRKWRGWGQSQVEGLGQSQVALEKRPTKGNPDPFSDLWQECLLATGTPRDGVAVDAVKLSARGQMGGER